MIEIPRSEINEAINHAREDLDFEQIGFFFITAERDKVMYSQAPNIAINPRVSSEVAAEWMGKQMMESCLTPIAMFHSHPSGSNHPSLGDRQFFPRQYVEEAFIWNHRTPTVLTQYDYLGHIRFVHLDGVIIGAAWGD